MVRCSIFYDNEKKEQFFMVRGDERYARSTKTILEYVSAVDDVSHFDCTLSVNVLRDTGEGSIVIYDNEVLTSVLVYDETTRTYVEMDSIPWSSLLNGLTFKVANLTYDVDHNFTAKYIGNKSCSPSNSNIITVNREDTYRTTSTINFEEHQFINQQFHTAHSQFSDNIVLSNEISAGYNINQTVYVHYDGELIDTLTTGDDGTVAFSLDDIGDIGLHILTLSFDGSRNLTGSEREFNFMVGYDFRTVTYDNPVVYGSTMDISVKIYKWREAYEKGDSTVAVLMYEENEVQRVTLTNSATHKGSVEVTQPIDSLYIEHDHNGHIHTSEIYPVTYIDPVQLSTSISPTPLTKGNTSVYTALLFPPTANVPIELTGSYEQTLYTNSNGVATYNAIGTGQGSKTFNASVGNLSDSKTVDDYLQYWVAGSTPINRDYSIYPSAVTSLLDLSNYFQIYNIEEAPSSSYPYPMARLYIGRSEAYDSWELVLENVRFSKLAIIGFVPDNQDPHYRKGISASDTFTFKLVKEEDTFTVYENGTVVSNTTVENWERNVVPPQVQFYNPTSNSLNVSFTKLTYRRL